MQYDAQIIAEKNDYAYIPILHAIDSNKDKFTVTKYNVSRELEYTLCSDSLLSVKINIDTEGQWEYQIGQNRGIIDVNSNLPQEENAYDSILQLDTYLYKAMYSQLDYDAASKYFRERYKGSSSPYMSSNYLGGCSSLRRGKFLSRNFDWYYTHQVEILVKTSSSPSRYASIGMSGNHPQLDKDFVKEGRYSEIYKYIPFTIVDGINEAGLAISVNVVPVGQKGKTTGTNPGKPEMSAMMIPRYILDNHSSAYEACKDIQANYNVYCPYSENFVEEFHYIVADAESTYVIEFINNKTLIIDVADYAYMTNFHLWETERDGDGNLIWDSVEDYGNGLERYQIITDCYDSLNEETDFWELAKKLQYTQLVDLKWLTEFCADYKTYELTVKDALNNPEKYDDMLRRAKEVYDNMSRDEGNAWQSEHVSIYNIEKKTLSLYTQENFDKKYTFSI